MSYLVIEFMLLIFWWRRSTNIHFNTAGSLMLMTLIVSALCYNFILRNIKEFVMRRWGHARMVMAEGTVIHVHPVRRGDKQARKSSHYEIIEHYPEVQYRTESGEKVSFRPKHGFVERRVKPEYEKGDWAKNQAAPVERPFYQGQSVSVRYDPQGEMEPQILFESAASTELSKIIKFGLCLFSLALLWGVTIWAIWAEYNSGSG